VIVAATMNDMHDLIAVADVPPLAGGDKQPTSEITLFKTGKFRHGKFGTWDISRETFDGFMRNFAKKGRVPIDFDHASEREPERDTEAAGWITKLAVVGDTMRATVEWTKRGAEAIRSRAYMYISPTWSFDGRDERGARVGPKLIGAGLTNRPHFESLPALNLTAAAADRFDVMWVEQEASADELQLARAWVKEGATPQLLEDLSPGFAEHFAELAIAHGINPAYAYEYQGIWRKNAHLHGSRSDELKIVEAGRASQRRWWDPISETLDRRPGGSASMAHEPGPFRFEAPPNLDDDGLVLHQQVVAFASEHCIDDYCIALAGLTGDHTAAKVQQRQEELPIDDVPDIEAARMRALDQRARALAAAEGVDYVDAGMLLELDDAIAEAEAEDGFSETPWLDTSRDTRPRPWSLEDLSATSGARGRSTGSCRRTYGSPAPRPAKTWCLPRRSGGEPTESPTSAFAATATSPTPRSARRDAARTRSRASSGGGPSVGWGSTDQELDVASRAGGSLAFSSSSRLRSRARARAFGSAGGRSPRSRRKSSSGSSGTSACFSISPAT
jgi:Mu-like prophage I protein